MLSNYKLPLILGLCFIGFACVIEWGLGAFESYFGFVLATRLIGIIWLVGGACMWALTGYLLKHKLLQLASYAFCVVEIFFGLIWAISGHPTHLLNLFYFGFSTINGILFVICWWLGEGDARSRA